MFFIRSSLLSTRKLFRRTLQSVKSLFSARATYQRLPKPPSFRQFSCQSYRELDRFYSEFTNLWDNELAVEDNVVMSASPKREVLQNLEEFRDDRYRLIAYEEMLQKDVIERRCLVAEKLKEMEMVDSNNLENARDIEEVLELYSLLTCPVYIDMLDKFVIDMYSDIFNLKASSNPKRSSACSSGSRLPHSSFLGFN